MTDYRDDIEKYLKGELTPAQRHALEKKALSDPFLADALDGGEQLDASLFATDVAALNKKIAEQKKSVSRVWPLRIAAGIILLAVSSFIVWFALDQEPESQLALQKSTEQEDKLDSFTDSVTQNETKTETKPDIASSNKPKPKLPGQPAKVSVTEDVKSDEAAASPAALHDSVKEKEFPRPAESPAPVPARTQDRAGAPSDNKELTLARKRELKITESKDNVGYISSRAADTKHPEGEIAVIDARPDRVTGRVMSAEDGFPLPGVDVALKGTSVTTKTDALGRYSIAARGKDHTLVYSSVGLESTEVKLSALDSTYLPVKMEDDAETQQEAVVETAGFENFGPTDVYTIPAHPETGNRSFKQYIEKNLSYPKEAKEKKVEGRVIIEFKVDAKGNLSEFKIVRGIGNGCDEEIIRLILQGAKWVPTTKDGVPVSDKARVKFKFELEE